MNLAIVETPFQLLCALELKLRSTKPLVLLVRYSGRGTNDLQMQNILKEMNVDAMAFRWPVAGVKLLDIPSLIGMLFTFMFRCESIYVGSYHSKLQMLLARTFRYRRLWCLDDGFATLKLLERTGGQCSEIKFFSIFPVGNGTEKTIVNDFRQLKALSFCPSMKRRVGVYFVGQPLVERGYIIKSKYLSAVAAVAKLYPNETVYYMPHRVESESLIDDLIKIANVSVLKLDTCVEWFFLKSDTSPVAVCGFNSTALYTARILDNDTEIVSFRESLQDYPDKKHLAAIDNCIDLIPRIKIIDCRYFIG